MYASGPFDRAIANLLEDRALRQKMGKAARAYVLDEHDLNRNYRKMEEVLIKMNIEHRTSNIER
jgi:glycosyltransferase involved in cell wall biosynthesis